MPKPKAYAHTTSGDVGTLPTGVGIAVGQTAPDFTLPDAHGKPVRLYDMLKRSAVLLVFYRGGW